MWDFTGIIWDRPTLNRRAQPSTSLAMSPIWSMDCSMIKGLSWVEEHSLPLFCPWASMDLTGYIIKDQPQVEVHSPPLFWQWSVSTMLYGLLND